MRLVRLNPRTDEHIYKTLYEWNQQTPPWFRASDDCWGVDSWDEFYERSQRDDLIDVAVYDGDELHGSITVVQVAPKVWEVFIIGRRQSNRDVLTLGAYSLAQELFAAGLAKTFTSWVCSLNRGALRLNRAAGMRETGIELYKGSYKGKPLRFLNFALHHVKE